MSNNTSDTNTPPDILYHYTTQSGLLGIINENSIRATDIFYLNDATEYTYAFDLMHEKIKELIEGLPPKDLLPAIGHRKLNKKDISQIKHEILESIQYQLKSLENMEEFKTYLCSFSNNPDQLSQWRGYCPNGNGFCIGFNTKKLIDLMRKYKVVKCIYKVIDQEKEIDDIFSDSIDKIDSIFNEKGANITDEEINKLTRETAFKLFEIAPRLKHNSFHAEEEWRFIACTKSKHIKYREGLSMITPYVDILLVNEETHLPIERLIVGPTPHKELSLSSAKSLLLNKGLNDCAESSTIPYRAW